MEIPGFQIQKEIGRGGMARVHLAVQNKFGRLVALKVVASDYANDVAFRKRFIRESRINAQLSHPNIVQVYDVGLHDSLLYLVLEYIASGDLNQRLARGMHVRDLVRVIRDIGRALDHAHEKGFIHRDIKPENILFRPDDSAVLTDFGIARVVERDQSLTRDGTVVGTPQYMSPEQAAGRELDGRSDLYSLGVVFYRMLTGDVPYKADSAVAIGIKHLQEPIPKLPSYLNVFQEVIDRALAKKPEYRYQTGAELTVALDQIKSSAQLPNATVKTMAVTTQEIRAVGGGLLTTTRDPSRAERQSRRRKRRRFARQSLAALVLVGAVGGVGYLFTSQPLWLTTLLARFDLAENPLVQTAWSDAQSLHQDPNQSLSAIVASYRRVVALDPEHAQALQTINGLAEQWKASVEASLLANDLAQAQTKLDESMTVFPEDPALVDLARQLTNRTHAGNLLLSTQALLRSHGLSDVPSATAAIQAYHEVLRLAPVHPVAQEELAALAEHYAGLAREAAVRGDVQGAISFLERATAANDEMPVLASVREEIRQATTVQAAIAQLVQQASEFRSQGLLVDPPGENAAELYHRVLATAPDNVLAQQGLDEVTSQLLNKATQMLNDGDLDGVQTLVDRASAAGIDAAALLAIKTQLDNKIAAIAMVDRNLTEARLLLEQGFITEPESGNAVSLLRDIGRLDPGNTMAAGLLAQAASRLADVAQEAHTVGLTDDAKHYLELALTVTPDEPAWRELRESWD